jgi:hypothetical protein
MFIFVTMLTSHLWNDFVFIWLRLKFKNIEQLSGDWIEVEQFYENDSELFIIGQNKK